MSWPFTEHRNMKQVMASEHKPQRLIDQQRAEQEAAENNRKPWDFPNTCEICDTQQDCYEGKCPCNLIGEFLEERSPCPK